MNPSDHPCGPEPPVIPRPARAETKWRGAGDGGAMSRVSPDWSQPVDNSGWVTLKVTFAARLVAAGSYSVTGRVGCKCHACQTGLAAGWPTHLPAGRATESFSLSPPSPPPHRD